MKFICKKCMEDNEEPCRANIPVGVDQTKKDVMTRMIVCPLIGTIRKNKRWIPNGEVNTKTEWKRVK